MSVTTQSSIGNANTEGRLQSLDLSTELIHTAVQTGLTKARNLSAKALRSSAGTYIYHYTMEQLNLLLSEAEWKLAYVGHQPRLVHPDGLLTFTVASGKNVAHADRQKRPHTRPKGESTRASLVKPPNNVIPLFPMQEVDEREAVQAAAQEAPFWFLLLEYTERGMKIELSRPAEPMTPSGVVNQWADRILVDFLDLDGDLSAFDTPDDEGIDIPIESH
jgi:hypothetical protein